MADCSAASVGSWHVCMCERPAEHAVDVSLNTEDGWHVCGDCQTGWVSADELGFAEVAETDEGEVDSGT